MINESCRSWQGFTADHDRALQELSKRIASKGSRMDTQVKNFQKSFQLASKTIPNQWPDVRGHKEADKIQDAQWNGPVEINEQRYHPKIDYRKRQVFDGIGDRWSKGEGKLINQEEDDPYNRRSRSEDIPGPSVPFQSKNSYETKGRMKFQMRDNRMSPWIYGDDAPVDQSENIKKLKGNPKIDIANLDIEIVNGNTTSNAKVNIDRIDFAVIDKKEAAAPNVSKQPNPWDSGRSFGRKKPGYTGYIKSVKAENLYGNTYGNVTQQVYTRNFLRGPEYPPGGLKYVTSYDREFNDINLVDSRMRPKDYFVSSSEQDPLNRTLPVQGSMARPQLRKKDDRREKSIVIEPKLQRGQGVQMGGMRSNSVDDGRRGIDTSTDPEYRKKINGIQKDGETKKTRLLVNKFGFRTKKEADTLPKEKKAGYDHMLKRNHWNTSYQQGIDIDSYGTNRQKYLNELRKTQNVWGKDPVLVDQIEKMKDSNEFRKEYPMVSNNPGGSTKYGSENYNYHHPTAKRGYARHELGYGFTLS